MTSENKPLPSKRGRKPGTKFTQRPRTDHEAAKRVQVPPEATVPRAEDRAANDVQQAARVEMLMLKGVSRTDLLGTMLGIGSDREVKRLVDLVHHRWSITGGGRDVTRHRGAALARLDLLLNELWAAYGELSNVADPMKSTLGKASLAKQILDVQREQNLLLGLTPRILERIALMPDTVNPLVSRLQRQEGLSSVADRLLSVLAERRARLGVPTTIDHEPAEDFSEDVEMTAH